MLQGASECPSSLWLDRIPLCIAVVIHPSSVDTWLLWVIVKNAAVNTSVQIPAAAPISVPSGVHADVRLLGHLVTRCNVPGTPQLARPPAQLPVPPQPARHLAFSSVDDSRPRGVRWHLTGCAAVSEDLLTCLSPVGPTSQGRDPATPSGAPATGSDVCGVTVGPCRVDSVCHPLPVSHHLPPQTTLPSPALPEEQPDILPPVQATVCSSNG